MLAGYAVVGAFVLLTVVPWLVGRLAERRRARAVARLLAG
jgi:hypothetical protein